MLVEMVISIDISGFTLLASEKKSILEMILNLYHYGFIFSANQPSIYRELMLLRRAELQRACIGVGKRGP